jgi:hypothetical protein
VSELDPEIEKRWSEDYARLTTMNGLERHLRVGRMCRCGACWCCYVLERNNREHYEQQTKTNQGDRHV